jgi:adenylate cyclase
MNVVQKNINAIMPYIPFRTLEKLASRKGHVLRRVEPLLGAVLFVDVVGFTKLTVSLSQVKPKGTEILQKILSDYYTELILVIREFGGIVYQFAGDAVLVSFEREETEDDHRCVHRAVTCAFSIQ